MNGNNESRFNVCVFEPSREHINNFVLRHVDISSFGMDMNQNVSSKVAREYCRPEVNVRMRCFVILWSGRMMCINAISLIVLKKKLKERIFGDWYLVQNGKDVGIEEVNDEQVVRVYGRLSGGMICADGTVLNDINWNVNKWCEGESHPSWG
jgi:hypothetical protein